MIAEVCTVLLKLAVTDDAAAGLASTAPHDITTDVAREHIAAAVCSAIVTGTDPSMLLAVAAHESHYRHDEATSEPPLDGWASCRGRRAVGRCAPRWSCGVMTPEPLVDRAECDRVRSSVVSGYVAGAEHLAGWFRMCRGNLRCATQGYASAWTVRHLCRGADQPRSCLAAAWFERRAAWIRRATAPPLWIIRRSRLSENRS